MVPEQEMMNCLLPDGAETPTLIPAVVARPVRRTGEVLIRVKAAGINRADMLQLAGKYPPPPGASEIIGLEVCGIVEAADPGCGVTPGTAVMALLAGGGYADYVCVDRGCVLPLPANLDWHQGAGVAEAFLTAYQALFAIGGLTRGQRVLIHAGASGVGSAAIQLAALAGAEVYATAGSEDKLTRLEALGITAGINYKTERFRERIRQLTDKRGVDVIVDFIGGSYLADNIDCCSLDGTIVSLAMLGGRFGEQLDFAKLLGKRITLTASTLRNRSDDYKAALVADFCRDFGEALADGRLSPVIDSVYPATAVNQAYARMAANANIGKLILACNPVGIEAGGAVSRRFLAKRLIL